VPIRCHVLTRILFGIKSSLRRVDHRLTALVLRITSLLLLAEFRLLLLLDKIAESAATRDGDVSDAGTLEVILSADFGTLHGLRNPVETEAGRATEEKARGIDGLIALHVGVLASTVVGLAESNTWQAPSNQAGVNWVEAAEETAVPGPGIFRALGVDVLAGLRDHFVKPLAPVVNILLINWTSAIVGGGSGGRSGHF